MPVSAQLHLAAEKASLTSASGAELIIPNRIFSAFLRIGAAKEAIGGVSRTVRSVRKSLMLFRNSASFKSNSCPVKKTIRAGKIAQINIRYTVKRSLFRSELQEMPDAGR